MNGASQRIEARSLDGGQPKTILENASHPRYLASGHLFMRDGNLMVVPFDTERLEAIGRAASVPLSVMVDNPGAALPMPQLVVSQNGTLAYAPRRGSGNEQSTFVWVEPGGHVKEIGTVPIRQPVATPVFSP
jgi:hypothetical protein